MPQTGAKPVAIESWIGLTWDTTLKNSHTPESGSLSGIEMFCKAAELQSFTSAARALGVTPAAVSRSIRRLEDRLGAQLFRRTTRLLGLTEAGVAFHERCRSALARITEAAQAVASERHDLSGLVRVSMPTTFGYCRVLPVLPRFLQAFPRIKLEIEISGRDIDFIEESFDVAIRLGRQKDSRLVARRLELASIGIFGSRDYLARRGVPETLDELRDHACIGFVMSSSGRHMPWFFRVDGHDVERRPDNSIDLKDDPLAMVHLARAGGGLVQTFHYIVQEDIESGRLIEVLPELRGPPRPYSLLYPSNTHLPARVRAFIDFLVGEFGGTASTGASRGA